MHVLPTSESIGSASLDYDGTLMLVLHDECQDEIDYATILNIKPFDPFYRACINYIGGIEYGEHKKIPPRS